MTNKFYMEGNNGGDNLHLEETTDGRVYIQIGHCCVYYTTAVVPVEVLTHLLGNYLGNDIVQLAEDILDWSEEYKQELMNNIQMKDFCQLFDGVDRPSPGEFVGIVYAEETVLYCLVTRDGKFHVINGGWVLDMNDQPKHWKPDMPVKIVLRHMNSYDYDEACELIREANKDGKEEIRLQ